MFPKVTAIIEELIDQYEIDSPDTMGINKKQRVVFLVVDFTESILPIIGYLTYFSNTISPSLWKLIPKFSSLFDQFQDYVEGTNTYS